MILLHTLVDISQGNTPEGDILSCTLVDITLNRTHKKIMKDRDKVNKKFQNKHTINYPKVRFIYSIDNSFYFSYTSH